MCRIGTRFHFTTDKGRVHKVTSLPHFREDTYVDRIDPKPIDSIELNQLISSCAALQSSSAQELLDTLADNRKDATHTHKVDVCLLQVEFLLSVTTVHEKSFC